MKKRSSIVLLIISFNLLGCATATFTEGKPFETSKVAAIQKGKTTRQEVVAWFGEPFTKSVAGIDCETWTYLFTRGQSKATSYVFKVDVKTEGSLSKLEVLLKDDVVQNFTFHEGAFPTR